MNEHPRAFSLPGSHGSGSLAPTMVIGRVVGIFIAEASGQPMQERESVELEQGRGIVGDRYHTGKGYWSDPRWPDQQLTLFEEEVALVLGVRAEELRRNLVTSGIDLRRLVGVRFRLAAEGPLIEGVRYCDPCRHVEDLTRPGLARELTGGRGGLRAGVLKGGVVTKGAAIILVH